MTDQETCGACNGSRRMPRDPNIGTDQECFVCDGSGFIAAHEAKQATAQAVPQGWTKAIDSVPLESDGEVFIRFTDGSIGTGWATYWHGSSNDFARWTFPDPDEFRLVSEWAKNIPASPGMHWTENEPVRLPQARTGRVYLAGPMTGISELNFPAFNQEAERLRAEGLQVLNPADHGIVDGADWADYLRHDIAGLASCERIHLLRGWTKSKGACLEMTIAKALGMAVTYQVDAEMEHSNVPAGPQEEGRPGIPLRKAYKHLLIVAPAQELGLTDEEIEAIAKKHMSTVGDHWCNEDAIRERHAEDFARAIIAAHEAKQAAAQAVPQDMRLVPVWLLERVERSLGAFTSDEGWAQTDMDTMDSVSAMIAATPAPAPADGRGTDAQIQKERDIARHAIVGALAAGYAGQAHPGADHWLAAAHDAGVRIKSLEAPAPAVPSGRTELEIVEQTEELAAYLMHWRFGQEPESPSVKFRDTENVKAQKCWVAACRIQEMITATDVENAVAEVDDAQAPAPAQEVGLTDQERADMACAVAAICTGTSSRTVAATAIEWTERALRAKGQT